MAGRLARWRPVHVAALVAALHVAWAAAFLVSGHEIRDFIRIGTVFVGQSDRSEVIRFDPTYDYPQNRDADLPGIGYDGQFYYFMALDPVEARHYMDVPGWRYQRPLYPAAARAVTLGDPDLIPWALLVINLAAAGLGTLFVAKWLQRRGHPAWWALLYGLTPGLLVGTQRDLTEPMSYALLAAAVLVFDRGQDRRWLLAAALFALAGLTRQTTLVFVPAFALALLLAGDGPRGRRARANLGRALAFGTVAILPFFVWASFVDVAIGDDASERNFTAFPFTGFFADDITFPRHGVSILTVGIPVVIWLVLAWKLVRLREAWPAALAVLFNGLLFVVFNVDSNAYTARGRGAMGTALALVYCLPALMAFSDRARGWLKVSVGLWLVMFPVVAVYGFTDSTFE